MQNAKSIAVGSFFMVLRQRMAALLLGLAVVGPAAAGEESESHISRPGLFFAWLSPDLGAVVVRADDAAHLRALARHCNAGRPVFALQAGEKYPCRIEVPKARRVASSGKRSGPRCRADRPGPTPGSTGCSPPSPR